MMIGLKIFKHNWFFFYCGILALQKLVYCNFSTTNQKYPQTHILSGLMSQSTWLLRPFGKLARSMAFRKDCSRCLLSNIFNRPGVAGAVLQTPSWLSDWLSHPFPPNLQDIINLKHLELGSLNFERMITPNHVSHVKLHMSGVTCQVSCRGTENLKLSNIIGIFIPNCPTKCAKFRDILIK